MEQLTKEKTYVQTPSSREELNEKEDMVLITILSSSSEFITFEIYLTDCVVNVTSVTWVTSLSRYKMTMRRMCGP